MTEGTASGDYSINTVQVISRGEQLAWVLTPAGGFLVSSIPDARAVRDAREAGILARADTLAEAEQLVRRVYGLQR